MANVILKAQDLIDTSTAIAQSIDSSLANNFNELF